jgi:hypothetical protein
MSEPPKIRFFLPDLASGTLYLRHILVLDSSLYMAILSWLPLGRFLFTDKG